MSTADTMIDGKNIIWQEMASAKGEKYSVGYPEGSPTERSAIGTVRAHGSAFGCQVNWPYASSSSWINTLPNVSQLTGITQYALTSGTLYTYTLYINTTQTYNYTFYDATGDGYGLNVFVAGSHYVSFNSSAPTILFVTGR